MKTIGDYGRLRIPWLLIDKPLYLAKGDAQAIVDRKHSAAIMQWRTTTAIADHNNDEGMWRLAYAIPNLTHATIEHNGVTTCYICTKKQRGIIRDGKMHDAQGHKISSIMGIDLLIYTCTGRKRANGTEVWLTYWKNN